MKQNYDEKITSTCTTDTEKIHIRILDKYMKIVHDITEHFGINSVLYSGVA